METWTTYYKMAMMLCTQCCRAWISGIMQPLLKEHNVLHPTNLHTTVMAKNVINLPWKCRTYCRIRTRI